MDSDWSTLSIDGKKLGSVGATKFGILDGKVASYTHMARCQIKINDKYCCIPCLQN